MIGATDEAQGSTARAWVSSAKARLTNTRTVVTFERSA
jgi:hypothetical protein